MLKLTMKMIKIINQKNTAIRLCAMDSSFIMDKVSSVAKKLKVTNWSSWWQKEQNNNGPKFNFMGYVITNVHKVLTVRGLNKIMLGVVVYIAYSYSYSNMDSNKIKNELIKIIFNILQYEVVFKVLSILFLGSVLTYFLSKVYDFISQWSCANYWLYLKICRIMVYSYYGVRITFLLLVGMDFILGSVFCACDSTSNNNNNPSWLIWFYSQLTQFWYFISMSKAPTENTNVSVTQNQNVAFVSGEVPCTQQNSLVRQNAEVYVALPLQTVIVESQTNNNTYQNEVNSTWINSISNFFNNLIISIKKMYYGKPVGDTCMGLQTPPKITINENNTVNTSATDNVASYHSLDDVPFNKPTPCITVEAALVNQAVQESLVVHAELEAQQEERFQREFAEALQRSEQENYGRVVEDGKVANIVFYDPNAVEVQAAWLAEEQQKFDQHLSSSDAFNPAEVNGYGMTVSENFIPVNKQTKCALPATIERRSVVVEYNNPHVLNAYDVTVVLDDVKYKEAMESSVYLLKDESVK